jgi:hypothetical protein
MAAQQSRQLPRAPRARRRRRAQRRRQEGAVMLVVMLVLMVATASAAVSVNTIQSEMHSAGNERVALQTRYLAETAMMTTISWIEMLADNGQLLPTWESDWQNARPVMGYYAEPEIVAAGAARTTMEVQDALVTNNAEITPVNAAAAPTASGSGGSGGSGGTSGSGGSGGSGGSTADYLGSFGPRQGYRLPEGGYVVDITDCHVAPSAGTPGAPIGGGPGSQQIIQLYCSVTARGRLVLPETAGAEVERRWTFGATTYEQRVYASSSQDSRALILTPEMMVLQ